MCPSPLGFDRTLPARATPAGVLSGVSGCGYPHHGNSRRGAARLRRHMPAIATHLLCLPGGARFTARPIRPDDKPALPPSSTRLSPESRRRRFLGPEAAAHHARPRVPDRGRPRIHVALAALDPDGAIVARRPLRRLARTRPATPSSRSPSSTSGTAGASAPRSPTALARAPARRTGPAALTGSTLSRATRPRSALLRRLGFKRV